MPRGERQGGWGGHLPVSRSWLFLACWWGLSSVLGGEVLGEEGECFAAQGGPGVCRFQHGGTRMVGRLAGSAGGLRPPPLHRFRSQQRASCVLGAAPFGVGGRYGSRGEWGASPSRWPPAARRTPPAAPGRIRSSSSTRLSHRTRRRRGAAPQDRFGAPDTMRWPGLVVQAVRVPGVPVRPQPSVGLHGAQFVRGSGR
jgi:hypothetical protein